MEVITRLRRCALRGETLQELPNSMT
jgi:hypothetical protein